MQFVIEKGRLNATAEGALNYLIPFKKALELSGRAYALHAEHAKSYCLPVLIQSDLTQNKTA